MFTKHGTPAGNFDYVYDTDRGRPTFVSPSIRPAAPPAFSSTAIASTSARSPRPASSPLQSALRSCQTSPMVFLVYSGMYIGDDDSKGERMTYRDRVRRIGPCNVRKPDASTEDASLDAMRNKFSAPMVIDLRIPDVAPNPLKFNAGHFRVRQSHRAQEPGQQYGC